MPIRKMVPCEAAYTKAMWTQERLKGVGVMGEKAEGREGWRERGLKGEGAEGREG